MSDEAKELQALLDAWHGSHADFHKFRDDKINSGEGAQVYGVGHYLGGLRGVSRHYTVQNTAKRNQGLISNLSFNGRDAKELHNWAGDLFAHLDHGVQLAKLDPTSSPHLADQLRREHAEEDKRLRDWGHDLGVSAELHDRMTKLHAQVLSQTLSELLYPEMRGSKGTPHYTLRSAASYYGQQYAQEALGRSQFHNGLNDTDDELKDHAENLARSVYTDLEPLVNQLKTAEPPHPGRLYKVQVKAHPDQMLDWDEPIKNHPKDVLEKLDNGRIIPVDLKDLDDKDTGYSLYRQATHFYEQLLDDAVYRDDDSYTFPKDLLQAFKDAGDDGRARRRVAGFAASKALLEAGIPGIKYQDGFSRGKVKPSATIDGHDVKSTAGTKILNVEKGALGALTVLMHSHRIANAPKTHDDVAKSIASWVTFEKRGTDGWQQAKAAEDWWAKNRHRVKFTLDKGSYNYVIFDPDAIEIVQKYDINDNLIWDKAVHLKAVDHDPFKE